MFDLGKKITVITGAGSGIGKAIAELFATRNATVYLVDLNDKGLEETKHNIESAGGRAIALRCNVASQDEVVSTFRQILNAESRVDILVNSAGVSHIGKLDTTNEKDFDRIFSV